MPPTASRKSSLGTSSRRAIQKAHIPYRGDDLEHGKKTGKAVIHVSRDADDFEPFDRVLNQAYKGGGVPRPVNPRSTVLNGHTEGSDNGDDSGELSMDIDSAHNSPSVYFNSTAAPEPSSAKRIGSLSRPLPRSSKVDYDLVPSPKPPRRSSPRSGTNSRPSNPSRLRREIQDDEEVGRGSASRSNLDSYATDGYEQRGAEYLGDDDVPESDNPSPNSHANLSFTALAQDDDNNILEDDLSPVSSRADKGKGRAEIQDSGEEDQDDAQFDDRAEDDVEIEEDIAVSLQEIEDTYEDQERDRAGPSKKKPRQTNGSPPTDHSLTNERPKKSQPKKSRAQPRVSMYETLDENGLRRSKRRRYPRLDGWRGEKVVWGRREHGRSVVPVIKDIITIPRPLPEPLGTKKRKRGGTHAPRSKSHASPTIEEVRVIEVENPEVGWDSETDPFGIVMDWVTQTEIGRRVAYTAKMINPKADQGNNYKFQKVFGDANFFAAGQVIIPPGEEKPAKPAKDNTYIFYVIEGAIECKVHRSSFVLASGGMFMVPRGNQYYIKNICQRDVKIFFAQARKVPEGDAEVEPNILPRTSAPSRAQTAPHSVSKGAQLG